MPATSRRKMSQLSKRTIAGVAISLFVALVTWGAKRYDDSKLDTSRFLLDSVRVENHMEGDHKILMRVDKKLNIIVCGRLPDGPEKRACEEQ